MIRWLRQTLIVARNTFAVFTGDPMIFIVNLFIIAATALIACLPGFTFGEQLRLVRDEILALTFIACGLAATIGAANSISDDIRRGMVPMLMSRPLNPSAFIWGKWVGVVAGLAVLTVSSATAFLWVSRIISREHFIEPLGVAVYALTPILILVLMTLKHYLFRGEFLSRANLAVTGGFLLGFLIINLFGYNGAAADGYGSLVDWSTLRAYLFLFMAMAIFAAIQTWLAVSHDQGILMATAVVVFFLGLFLDFGLSFLPVPALRALIQVFLPNWQLYWLADAVAEGTPFSPLRFIACLFHALGQSALFLFLASRLFGKKEYQGGF